MRKVTIGFIVLVALCGGALAYILYAPEPRSITFPDGKRFAFTIVDDTDMTTAERSRPLYDVLHRYGLRTTKTVWVLESSEPGHEPNRGHSLRDPEYRAYIGELHSKGFEIALHGARGGSSTRKDIELALEEFRSQFGQYPKIHVNHSRNKDNVYWGPQRWSFGPYRWAYSLLGEDEFSGEDPQSPYYWGDLVQQRVQYVNQFTFLDVNLLNVTPSIPYRLSDKPLVNYWFPTADGDNLDHFAELLKPENLDRLEREGGVCLVYTHMGAGSFNQDGKAHPQFEARIRDVASRNGWFAPASEILDYLAKQPGWNAEPTFREKVRLETLFLWTLVKRSFVRPPKVLREAEQPGAARTSSLWRKSDAARTGVSFA